MKSFQHLFVPNKWRTHEVTTDTVLLYCSGSFCFRFFTAFDSGRLLLTRCWQTENSQLLSSKFQLLWCWISWLLFLILSAFFHILDCEPAICFFTYDVALSYSSHSCCLVHVKQFPKAVWSILSFPLQFLGFSVLGNGMLYKVRMKK